MSAIIPAILSLPISMAPMPVILPDYDLECRAGAMTGLSIVRMNISVRNEDGQRKSVIRAEEGMFDASLNSRAIPMDMSIGGKGFVEELEYGSAQKRSAVVLMVRGEVTDNIIDFHVFWRMNERGVRQATNLVGNCSTIAKDSRKGSVQ